METIRNFFSGGPKTPEVVAAEAKVQEAQEELEAAKRGEGAAPSMASPTQLNSAMEGARRRKTRRSKSKKASKRRRTGRKSSHP